VFDIPHNGAFVTEGVRPRALQHVVDGLINIVHRRLDPEQRPLSELFPQTSRRSRASSADVTAARERLAAGEAFSDEQVYEIYAPQRPQYRAYLAAWKIRQALGYDKSDVRIETELTKEA